MILKKFTNIYPRTFWVVIIDKEQDIHTLAKKFTILDLLPGFNEIREHAEEEMVDSYIRDTVAECRPVIQNSNGELGILCIIYRPDEVDSSLIAHESVHIADYYFEVTGMHSEDFSDGGNEGYAYLVGWAAGCFTKIMQEYAKAE